MKSNHGLLRHITELEYLLRLVKLPGLTYFLRNYGFSLICQLEI